MYISLNCADLGMNTTDSNLMLQSTSGATNNYHGENKGINS